MQKVFEKMIEQAKNTVPDEVIGEQAAPYLKRWHKVANNPYTNIYLHQFLKSDPIVDMHDHPWPSVSLVLQGTYVEHTIAAGGIHQRQEYKQGDLICRLSAKFAHRIEVKDSPVWTLFVTGKKSREWGFHCPTRGWVHWKDYTNPNNRALIGKGCEG